MANKSLETRVFGHRFRSRLEARWATFFEALHIPYKYESEGFNLNGVNYLPDFYLPDQKAWFEVKGGEISADDENKVIRLAAAVDFGVKVCVFGDIPRVQYSNALELDAEYPYRFMSDSYGHAYNVWVIDGVECPSIRGVTWYICPWCERITIQSIDLGMTCSCHDTNWPKIPKPPCTEGTDFISEFWWNRKMRDLLCRTENHPLLMKAYLAATEARFEHGEKPLQG